MCFGGWEEDLLMDGFIVGAGLGRDGFDLVGAMLGRF